MLMRFDPFREFDRLTQEPWGGARRPHMSLDAVRQGDRLVARFDLPGVAGDSIDLTVEKNVLTVRAERTWERREGDEVLVSERSHGTFTRRLLLGDNLNTDAIEASYEDGVLTVTIPVAERAKARKVAVAGAKAGLESGGDAQAA
jgi:HSP20 family protein